LKKVVSGQPIRVANICFMWGQDKGLA
jgi:hypothetical protein